MFDTVYQVVTECPTCFRAKGPTHKVKPPLKLFRDGILHGRWHVDFCGPFVETPVDKFKYILVAVEAFSGWPVAVPTRTQPALETAQKLVEHVFSIYGCPLSITSDCGRQFESQVLQDVMTLYGISRTKTTPFHPRAYGKVEVFIRTLKQHLQYVC